MRRLAIFAVGLFLMSPGQLGAQAADPFEGVNPPSDPFGSFGNAPHQVEPNKGPSVSQPEIRSADQPNKRALPRPDALFPPVRAGRAATAQTRIEDALNRETAFDYLDQPLKDVIADISFSNHLPIVIDTVALEDFGIDTGTPITLSLKGISLRSALRLTLRNLTLTFVIRDEVLHITTTEAAAATPTTRFYHIAELLPPNGDGEVLVELIKKSVAPKTWCGSDRVGSIIYVEHLESLAIRQSDEVFHEIEELLAATKKLAELQPPLIGDMIAE